MTRPPPRNDALDAELLRLIAARQATALEQLYLAYHRRLAQFLARLSTRPEIVDEAINDTFWIVWQKAAEFRGKSRVSTWVMGIAWRCALKSLRRASELPPGAITSLEALLPLELDPEADDSLVTRESQQWLERGLDSLPFEQRATLELAYYLGHSCDEIAAIMGCPVNTVKARMFQARIKLRNLLPVLEQPVQPQPGSRTP